MTDETRLCPACEGDGERPIRNDAGARIGVEVCPRCHGRCYVATDPRPSEPVGEDERPNALDFDVLREVVDAIGIEYRSVRAWERIKAAYRITALRTRLERERDEAKLHARQIEIGCHGERDEWKDHAERAEAALAAERESIEERIRIAMKAGAGVERAKKELDAFDATEVGQALKDAHEEVMKDTAEELRAMSERITALEAERDRLRSALEWYAAPSTWERGQNITSTGSHYASDGERDAGRRARAAIHRTEE